MPKCRGVVSTLLIAMSAVCLRRVRRPDFLTIENSFGHLYDTGGVRRTHLRGHTNILKRLLIHAGGFTMPSLAIAESGTASPSMLSNRLT
jgi:transposase